MSINDRLLSTKLLFVITMEYSLSTSSLDHNENSPCLDSQFQMVVVD